MINYFDDPSIYTNPDDTLTIYVGEGAWTAKNINSPWTSIDPAFPESGPQTRCDSPASVHHSLIGMDGNTSSLGVTGFFVAGKDGNFIHQAARDYDIYVETSRCRWRRRSSVTG